MVLFGHTAGVRTGPYCAVFQQKLQHRDRWHRLQSSHSENCSVPLLLLKSCYSSLRQSLQLCSPARSELTPSKLYINQEIPHFVFSGHTKQELVSHSMHTYQVESKGNEPVVFAKNPQRLLSLDQSEEIIRHCFTVEEIIYTQ